MAYIAPGTLALVRADWHAAGRGQKSAVVRSWASHCGVSPQTLYRQLDTGRQRNGDKGRRKVEGLEDAAMTVAKVRKMSPECKGDICTEDAIQIAVENGLISPEMARRRSSIDRIIRENGAGRSQRRRVSRYQAERPNQLHHVDASSSECFFVDRVTDDGEVVLKLWKGHKIYKNKPTPVRYRVWVYGLTDDHSGLHVARYVMAMGETAADNLDFLQWAWAATPDKEFCGLPESIKGDLGPMLRGPAAQDFLNRFGVEILPSIPGAKEAHGKIERPWRTMWERFERPFFVEDPKAFEITLDEVNERFARYVRKYNAKAHRWERKLTRLDAWKRINQQGGAVPLPPGAVATVARRYERRVGQDGVLWLDRTPYEVVGLHDADVWVFLGLEGDRIAVQEKRTGEKFEVRPFVPNPVGTFRSAPDTGGQTARKAAEAELRGKLSNTLYTEDEPAEAANPWPVRKREAPEVEDVFDMPDAGDTYRSLEAAVADFCALTGSFLAAGSEERSAVEGLILDGALNKEYVRALADDVNVENERDVADG